MNLALLVQHTAPGLIDACTTCNGQGYVDRQWESITGTVRLSTEHCEKCNGNGFTLLKEISCPAGL